MRRLDFLQAVEDARGYRDIAMPSGLHHVHRGGVIGCAFVRIASPASVMPRTMQPDSLTLALIRPRSASHSMHASPPAAASPGISVSQVGCPAGREAMKRRMSMGRGLSGMVRRASRRSAPSATPQTTAPPASRGAVVQASAGSIDAYLSPADATFGTLRLLRHDQHRSSQLPDA